MNIAFDRSEHHGPENLALLAEPGENRYTTLKTPSPRDHSFVNSQFKKLKFMSHMSELAKKVRRRVRPKIRTKIGPNPYHFHINYA